MVPDKGQGRSVSIRLVSSPPLRRAAAKQAKVLICSCRPSCLRKGGRVIPRYARRNIRSDSGSTCYRAWLELIRQELSAGQSPQQISNARNDCCRRREDPQAKGEGWRCGRLRRGVGGFGPTGTKSRRGGGEGRAGLVRRSSEFGAADARPKLSTHRSGGGRCGCHRCEQHGRDREGHVSGPRCRWQERSRRGRPIGGSGGERA